MDYFQSLLLYFTGQFPCFFNQVKFTDKFMTKKFHDLKIFQNLNSLSRLKIDNFPPKIDVIQRDVLEFEVHVADANPAPKLNWFIGSKESKFRLFSTSFL